LKPRGNKLGNKNIVGEKVVTFREKHGIKQKDFLARLQVLGLDISPTSLSRLEGQYRLVHDYEVAVLATALSISADELLDGWRNQIPNQECCDIVMRKDDVIRVSD